MSTSAVTSGWMRVGQVAPSALSDTRLQLHHAAQIAVSAAISYIAARPDDSHTALTWVAPLGCLATEPITATRQFRIALRVEDLTLHMLDQNESATHSFTLPGRTVAEAQQWLVEVLAQAALDPARFTARKHYTIPAHPVASGATFSADRPSQLQELARYWSNAAGLLAALARRTEGAGLVRTWPHHFDIATLIALPGGSGKTVGVGQSPGDEFYDEPYWYVGPYPSPSVTALPPIGGSGHWHTRGWVGAVLPASDYVDAPDQRSQVTAFVDSAVSACRTLLGA
jgi:hypothetical protein